MTHTTPPSLRRTLTIATPWLVALGFGALAHASYWLAGEPAVRVVTIPIPPPVVHVEAAAMPACPPAAIAAQEAPRPAIDEAIDDMVWLVASDPTDAVRCEGEVCVIDRAAVLDPHAPKLPTARIVPSMKEGEVVGLKLYGVRSNSLLHAMGLKNGDLVVAVDGRTLRGLDDAMAAFARLRHASDFTLHVDRRGQPITKRYRLE